MNCSKAGRSSTRACKTKVFNQVSYDHRIARSRVQTPLKSWLFHASIHNCLKWVYNWHGMIIAYLISKSAVQWVKYFIYHFSLMFFVVKYANLWRSCCGRRRACLVGSLSNHDADGNKNPKNLHIWQWKTVFLHALHVHFSFFDIL